MKKNKWIILLTTVIVFLGYQYSKEKNVPSSKTTIKKTTSDVSMGFQNNEATLKDWSKLFKRIIDKKS